MRGNNVMAGYFDDPEATATAFRGGWFHSGDLAVWHPDGNVELRDRGKDIIISGGENISSIEVEQTIVAAPVGARVRRRRRSRTRTGASAQGVRDAEGRARPRPRRRSSRSPASASRTTSARTRSSSARCRRRRPARSRSTCCARRSGPGTRRASGRVASTRSALPSHGDGDRDPRASPGPHRAAGCPDHAEPAGEAERALARADGGADRGARGGRRATRRRGRS